MRRLFTLVLLALLYLPAVSPLFALTASEDASVPMCCRRHGVHHCMGLMHNDSNEPHFEAPSCCQQSPLAHAVTVSVHAVVEATPSGIALSAHLLRTPAEMTAHHSGMLRAGADRGPPALSIA